MQDRQTLNSSYSFLKHKHSKPGVTITLMKKHLNIRTSLLVILFALAGCGGGGSSAGNSGTTSGTIADPTSAIYLASLKAFAQTYIAGFYLLPSLYDLANATSYHGTANGGGTISTVGNGVANTTTFGGATFIGGVTTGANVNTNPSGSGTTSNTYTMSGTVTTASDTFSNSNTVLTTNYAGLVGSGVAVSSPNKPSFTIIDIPGLTSVVTYQFPDDTVSLSNSTNVATFTIGSSSYQISSLNVQASTPALGAFNIMLTGSNTIFAPNLLYQIAYNATTTYNVTLSNGPLVIIGQNSVPSSGAQQISGVALPCTPITVQYVSATQFSLSCGGNTVTKNWSDADVVSALSSASQ